eukprot:34394_6
MDQDVHPYPVHPSPVHPSPVHPSPVHPSAGHPSPPAHRRPHLRRCCLELVPQLPLRLRSHQRPQGRSARCCLRPGEL